MNLFYPFLHCIICAQLLPLSSADFPTTVPEKFAVFVLASTVSSSEYPSRWRGYHSITDLFNFSIDHSIDLSNGRNPLSFRYTKGKVPTTIPNVIDPSTTQAACKIMKTVKLQLDNYLLHKNLLHESQPDFIGRRSCFTCQSGFPTALALPCNKDVSTISALWLKHLVEILVTNPFPESLSSGSSTSCSFGCHLTLREAIEWSRKAKTDHQWCYPGKHSWSMPFHMYIKETFPRPLRYPFHFADDIKVLWTSYPTDP